MLSLCGADNTLGAFDPKSFFKSKSHGFVLDAVFYFVLVLVAPSCLGLFCVRGRFSCCHAFALAAGAGCCCCRCCCYQVAHTLRQVDVLQTLTLLQVHQLCDVLTEVVYEAGQTIITQVCFFLCVHLHRIQHDRMFPPRRQELLFALRSFIVWKKPDNSSQL